MLPDIPAWPHADASRSIDAAGLSWHVQIMGRGPVALLLHGTGGATHSWIDVAPLLAQHFTVIAPDLPGHGFTSRPATDRLSIRGMAADTAALLAALGAPPVALVVGHSAGAAIALRLVLDGAIAPALVAGINAALEAPPAAYTACIGPVVDVVARSPLTARLASVLGRRQRVIDSLLGSTGSVVPAAQRARYGALLRSPDRVGAVLTMMANWDLADVWADTSRLTVPVLLIAADRDDWVPPRVAIAASRRLPHASVVVLTGLGHLAHEEGAGAVVRVILDAARAAGLSIAPTAASVSER
jgi:magnesium chelatase accessory protein